MCLCVHAHSGGRFIHRFLYLQHLLFGSLETLCILFKLDEFRFVFIIILPLISFYMFNALLSSVVGLFFPLSLGCAHCFGSLYHTDCVYDVYKVNEIKIHNESKATKQKQKQQREKNECKVRTSRISELCLMFDDDHSKYVQLCTCC